MLSRFPRRRGELTTHAEAEDQPLGAQAVLPRRNRAKQTRRLLFSAFEHRRLEAPGSVIDDALLRVENATRVYVSTAETVTALAEVSLSVSAGEFLLKWLLVTLPMR